MTPNLQQQFPQEALQICWRLQEAGFDGVIVGGPVRDALLGRVPEDIDLATSATPQQVQQLFDNTFTVGKGERHGTVGVQIGQAQPMEVTTFRLDVKTHGRHAEVEFTDDVRKDLARRDFTINAMAFRPGEGGGEVLDPFDGQTDLHQKRLQAVGQPQQRIQEDWLRVMRGYRFAGRFGLKIEEQTHQALQKGRQGLKFISIERIRDELLKMNRQTPQGNGRLQEVLELMDQDKILQEIFTELKNTDPESRREAYQTADLLEANSLLRMAPLAKLANQNKGGSPAHTEPIGEKLKLSNEQTQKLDQAIHILIENPTLADLTATDLRHMKHRCPALEIKEALQLLWAQQLTHHPEAARKHQAALQQGQARARRIERENHATQITELAIGGKEVMDVLEIQPGPQVGEVLEQLLQEVLQNPRLNQRELLLEQLKKQKGPQNRQR